MARLRTLGTIDLRDARDTEVRPILVQPRRLALLVALALSRPFGFQRRDRLAALFWPEESEDRARAALSRAVYFLRAHLGDGAILSRGSEEIAIDRSILTSDAEDFVIAMESGDQSRALDLYHGELLPAFFVSGAPGFEEWLESERASLRFKAVAAASALSASAETSGDLQRASHMARRAVDLAPLDEIAVRHLLHILDCSGDRAGAVLFFQQFERDLDMQLGVEPAPETRALADAIRAREEGAPPTVTTAPPVAPSVTASSTELPVWRRARTLALVAAGAVLVMLPWLAARRKTVDIFRVDVGAFTTEGTARRDLGDSVEKRFFEGLKQSGLIRTTTSTRGYSGWRMSLPLDSLNAGRSRWHVAGTTVSGSLRVSGDSIVVLASVADRRREGRVWEITVPGAVRDIDSLVDQARRRVAGAVAILGNAYYATLLPKVGEPPLIEAWREFVEGTSLRFRDAVPRYRVATALDPAFTWPLVHAALTATTEVQELRSALADGVLKELGSAREQLGPLERRLSDYVFAVWAGDWEACYRHMRDVAAIAPQQFSYMEAVRATHLHRPHDAIVALTRPAVERFSRGSLPYWLVLAGAYHEIGDHRHELRAVQSARAAAPSNPGLLMQELKAFAALGMIDSALIRVDSLREQPRTDWITPGAAWTGVAEELRAHGHDAEAKAMFERAIAWFRHRPAAEAATETHRYFLAAALYSAGELAAADSIFRLLHREHPSEVDYAGYLAAIAARQGDRTTALRLAHELVGYEVGAWGPGELSIFWRAAVAALLGNREEAMRLLVAAYGQYGTDELHTNRDFDGLRDYAPFREFLRPKS